MKHMKSTFITYLVEVQSYQGIFFTWNNNDCISPNHSWREEGNETKQRKIIRTSNSDHSNWLVDLDRRSIQSCLLQ